jgi:hypothetical protein
MANMADIACKRMGTCFIRRAVTSHCVTGRGIYKSVIESVDHPTVYGVALAAILRPYNQVIRPHTGGVNTIVTFFTGLSANSAVVEQCCRTDREAHRGMTTLAGSRGNNMCRRLACGKYVIMTFFTLYREFFKQAPNMTLFALQALVFAFQWESSRQMVEGFR